MKALKRYTRQRHERVDYIFRRVVIPTPRRPDIVEVGVADAVIAAASATVTTAVSAAESAVMVAVVSAVSILAMATAAVVRNAAAVVVGCIAVVAAATDDPCRHAYRGLHCPRPCQYCVFHVPRFIISDCSEF